MKSTKYKICELLGVELEEEFKIKGFERDIFRINKYGEFQTVIRESSCSAEEDIVLLCRLINDPDLIVRKPKFTKQDIEDAKYIKRILKADSINRVTFGNTLVATKDDTVSIVINPDLFPNICYGQKYDIEKIIRSESKE